MSRAYRAFCAWCENNQDAQEVGARLGMESLDDLSLSFTLSTVESQLGQSQAQLEERARSQRGQEHLLRVEDVTQTSAGISHSLASQGSVVASESPSLKDPRASSAHHPSLSHSLQQSDSKNASRVLRVEQKRLVPLKGTERYEILHAKRGGLGVVYFCFDHQQDYPFVIKTFRDELFHQREDILSRFFREATVWQQMGCHPHLVQAYGMRLIGNSPYLFLEFIPGQTLREVLQRSALLPADAITAAIHICLALRWARSRMSGFIHRDLKPSNILVCRDLIKITDLGLAQVSWEIGGSRQEVAGTPAYMAPEQWAGQALTEKTDIYAIGLLLYEMIVGEKPFAARDRQGYRLAHQNQPPPGLPSAVESPKPLASLIEQCLAKDASRRPGLNELLEQLKQLRRQPGILLRLPAAWEYLTWRCLQRLGKTKREHRLEQVMHFGRTFSRGLVEAIAEQLKSLQGTRVDEAILGKLFSLSRLRSTHLAAFEDWDASTLDFSGISLTNKFLPRLYLPRAQLAKIQGTQANLWGACLSQANLCESQLDGVVLGHANLREAMLSGATLAKSVLRNANLEKATLAHACLAGVNFIEANLQNADLEGADLSGADLTRANLQSARLPGAFIKEARLTGARYNSSTQWPITFPYQTCGAMGPYALLTETDWSCINLPEADLEGIVLRYASLHKARLSRANLNRADLQAANLSFALLKRASLCAANLSYADLRQANLTQANLRRANLFHADLEGANLTGALYTADTQWPTGFSPAERGAILLSNSPPPDAI